MPAPHNVVEVSFNRAPADEIDLAEFPKPDKKCFQGIAGQFALAATKTTEADPIAVLMTLLTKAGSYFGRDACLWHGGIRFPSKLYCGVAGASARGRKGTSVYPVTNLFEYVDKFLRDAGIDPAPATDGTVSSGEGLVYALRDASEKTDKDTGDPEDKGITDKRLFILEEELGGLLAVARRDGSSVTAVLRKLWDPAGNYRPITKLQPIKTTGTHVCLLGHVSPEELRKTLGAAEAVNGFANRFIWVCTKRSKILSRPEAMPASAVKIAATEFAEAIKHAASLDKGLSLSPAALDRWDAIYLALNQKQDAGGMVPKLLHRAEAQILRIALILALIQRADAVDVEHLEVAQALWDYSERSVYYLFGSEVDEDEIKIIAFIRNKGGEAKQTEIHQLAFNGRSSDLNRKLLELEERSVLVRRKQATKGRPATYWQLCTA
jgi:hypothetical protein